MDFDRANVSHGVTASSATTRRRVEVKAEAAKSRHRPQHTLRADSKRLLIAQRLHRLQIGGALGRI
jgi:hypothetical protein